MENKTNKEIMWEQKRTIEKSKVEHQVALNKVNSEKYDLETKINELNETIISLKISLQSTIKGLTQERIDEANRREANRRENYECNGRYY